MGYSYCAIDNISLHAYDLTPIRSICYKFRKRIYGFCHGIYIYLHKIQNYQLKSNGTQAHVDAGH